MKGYFNRKPMNVDEVKAVIKEGVRRHAKPVEIESLGRIVLPLDDYIRFCRFAKKSFERLKFKT